MIISLFFGFLPSTISSSPEGVLSFFLFFIGFIEAILVFISNLAFLSF